MTGQYILVESAILTLFVVTTAGNAVAGYWIAGRAGRQYEGLFRTAALFQISLVYFAWRFSPRCPPAPWLPVRLADCICATGIILGIVFFGHSAISTLPAATSLPLVVGCFALALLAGCVALPMVLCLVTTMLVAILTCPLMDVCVGIHCNWLCQATNGGNVFRTCTRSNLLAWLDTSTCLLHGRLQQYCSAQHS